MTAEQIEQAARLALGAELHRLHALTPNADVLKALRGVGIELEPHDNWLEPVRAVREAMERLEHDLGAALMCDRKTDCDALARVVSGAVMTAQRRCAEGDRT